VAAPTFNDEAARPGARRTSSASGVRWAYLESRKRAATAALTVNRPGNRGTGWRRGDSWHHLKRCKWVLGSTRTMPLKPTGRCLSAGAVVLGLMVRRGFTFRTSDNWSVRCDGLMRRR